MKQAAVITSLLFFMMQVQSARLCSICFNWKVSNDSLTLICKVSDLRFRVSFVDPNSDTIADCIYFPKELCDTYGNDCNITVNLATNETVLIIKGNVDYHLNGIWKCQHGYKSTTANVEVTVLRKGTETHNNTKQSVPLLPEKTENTKWQCLTEILVYSMASFILSIVSTSLVSAWKSECLFKLNDKLWRKTDKNGKGTTRKMQIGFATVTTILFLFNCLIGYFDDGSCQYIKWILTAVAFIIGIVCSCFCLVRYVPGRSTPFSDDIVRETLDPNQDESNL